MGEMRNVYKNFSRKHEVKKSLGRSRHRWENNITNEEMVYVRVWTGFKLAHCSVQQRTLMNGIN